MGQVVLGWASMTEAAATSLFNGSDSSIAHLTTLIANGQWIGGPNDIKDGSDTTLQNSIELAFYTYTIPAVWSFSGTRVFVIDAGYPCGTKNPLSGSGPEGTGLDNGVAEATYVCYNGDIYYLVYPKDDEESCGICNLQVTAGCVIPCVYNSFSAPPGLDKLVEGNPYGGVTLPDLVIG